jgi:hypothetical protein
MLRFRATMVSFTAIVLTLSASAAQAMTIIQFDKMALQDQADYITALVNGAQKVLTDQRKDEIAVKTYKLMTDVRPGDTIPFGMIQFEENLDRARLFDAQTHAKDANAQRVEVEDAMAATLQKNGIELPDAFFAVNNNFRPKLSPKR